MEIIKIFIILSLSKIHIGAALKVSTNENEFCKEDRKLEKDCGFYTYSVIKPLLDYFRKINEDLEKSQLKDRQIEDQKKKLEEQKTNEAIIQELKNQISVHQNYTDFLKQTLAKSTVESDHTKTELANKTRKLEELEDQVFKLNDTLSEKINEIFALNKKIQNHNDNPKVAKIQLKETPNKNIEYEKNLIEITEQLVSTKSVLSEKLNEISELKTRLQDVGETQQKCDLQLEGSKNNILTCERQVQECMAKLSSSERPRSELRKVCNDCSPRRNGPHYHGHRHPHMMPVPPGSYWNGPPPPPPPPGPYMYNK